MYIGLKKFCNIAFNFKNKEQRIHVLSLIKLLESIFPLEIEHFGPRAVPNYIVFRAFGYGNPSIAYFQSKPEHIKTTQNACNIISELELEIEFWLGCSKTKAKENENLKNEVRTIKEEKIFDYKSFNLSKLSVSELNDLSKKSSDLRADLIKEKPTDQLAIENGIAVDRYDTVRHGTVIVYKGTAKIKMANGSLWEAKGIPTDGCAECIFRRSYIDYRRLE